MKPCPPTRRIALLVDDQEFIYEGLSVTYRHRRSKQDRRHLLVVFSGGFHDDRRYDLDGSLVDGIRTDILWIRDNFDGDFSYYIRTHRRGTLVAEAVNALIEKVRLERGLEKHHCTSSASPRAEAQPSTKRWLTTTRTLSPWLPA